MPFTVKGECRNTGKTHFKKGFTPWNKGKTGIYSDERRAEISEFMKERIAKHGHHQQGKAVKAAVREKIKNTLKKNCSNLIGQNVGYVPNWKSLTEIVFQRDNYCCQECGIRLARIKGPQVIQCHHIDCNTANNDLSNLITLCASCHCKTTFKREEWMLHFRSKLSTKQSYK